MVCAYLSFHDGRIIEQRRGLAVVVCPDLLDVCFRICWIPCAKCLLLVARLCF